MKQTSACQNSFKMEIQRKVTQLFLSAVTKDKWLSAQKRARASSVRQKHKPNGGCPGRDQLGGCRKRCAACWTAPAGEGKWGRWWEPDTDNSPTCCLLPNTARSAGADYANTWDIPLFPLNPIRAIQLPECQAEFCKEASKSLSYFYACTSEPLQFLHLFESKTTFLQLFTEAACLYSPVLNIMSSQHTFLIIFPPEWPVTHCAKASSVKKFLQRLIKLI